MCWWQAILWQRSCPAFMVSPDFLLLLSGRYFFLHFWVYIFIHPFSSIKNKIERIQACVCYLAQLCSEVNLIW
jgi:hypothetical protein